MSLALKSSSSQNNFLPFQELGPACPYCALPLAESERTCFSCLQKKPVWNSLYCHYVFDESLRQMLWDVKFKREFFYLKRTLAQIPFHLKWDFDYIVPVPITDWRLWKRRFNQSYLIAEALAEHSSRKIRTDLLKRKFSLGHQSALKLRDRRIYLKNKFYCKKDLQGKKILLVDDIVTSSYTIETATQVLKDAGAEKVYVWALARTLKKGKNYG